MLRKICGSRVITPFIPCKSLWEPVSANGLTIESKFKPKLVSELGVGGQAKVFKATFHGKDVAMKYIPLDKVKDGYKYESRDYGCDEFYYQEKFCRL